MNNMRGLIMYVLSCCLIPTLNQIPTCGTHSACLTADPSLWVVSISRLRLSLLTFRSGLLNLLCEPFRVPRQFSQPRQSFVGHERDSRSSVSAGKSNSVESGS
jgi:hypothetical protein